jgi:hypothetical protein
MFDPSTEPTTPQFAPKVAKQYAIFVIVLSLGLITLCTVLDQLRPIDFGPTGRLGPRVWLYDSPGTYNAYGGDNQFVTSNNTGIRVFDIPIKEVFTSREHLLSPVVSGRWLAYVKEAQQVPRQIKVLSLETGEEIALDQAELGQGEPAISGNWVVFSERSPNDDNVSNIYAYDLSKGTRLPIAAEGGQIRCCPKVSKQWVIYLQWQALGDSRRTPIELRAHSLATGEDFAIGPLPAPNDSSFGTLHALDNDKVVWVREEPDRTRSLHLYDLTKREDQVLPSEPGYVGDVSITDKQHLVVVNNGGWKVVDWAKPQPTHISLPWSSNVNGLRAGGDYLVGSTSRDVFVAPILP